MFPASVRDRVIAEKTSTHSSLQPENTCKSKLISQPIAELFPECTILYADIAGFTQWSAEREPTEGM
jgi:class 3 adenylate cyclase